MGRRRRRRGGFFRRLGRGLSRIGKGIRRGLKKHGGKILGALVATTPFGLVAGVAAGALLDRRNKKRRQSRVVNKKPKPGTSKMPEKITPKDFTSFATSDTKEWTMDDHWNPRDGWVKDLNGDGTIGIEDFKRAVYPEHKRYIRDWILSQQFDKNQYLDLNGDGVVDIKDYVLAKDEQQKFEIENYVKSKGGNLTGFRMTGFVCHMVNREEKEFIFSTQSDPDSGLRGKESEAILTNISIDEVLEYHEAVKKFGTDVGRPMVRGVNWEGADSAENIKQAITIIKDKLPDRFAQFFENNMTPKLLRGKRGTTFKITEREDSDVVDVVEVQPQPDVNGYVLVISGDFQYGDGGDVFSPHEDIIGIGTLEGLIKTGTIKKPTKNQQKKLILKKSGRRLMYDFGKKQKHKKQKKRRGPRLGKRRSRRRRRGGVFGRLRLKPSRRFGNFFRRRRRRGKRRGRRR